MLETIIFFLIGFFPVFTLTFLAGSYIFDRLSRDED